MHKIVKTVTKKPLFYIYMRTWVKLQPTYVESLGPHDIGKESFVKLGPANQESIGDIGRVSNCLFSVSSYILVLRLCAGMKSELQNTNSSQFLFVLRWHTFWQVLLLQGILLQIVINVE